MEQFGEVQECIQERLKQLAEVTVEELPRFNMDFSQDGAQCKLVAVADSSNTLQKNLTAVKDEESSLNTAFNNSLQEHASDQEPLKLNQYTNIMTDAQLYDNLYVF